MLKRRYWVALIFLCLLPSCDGGPPADTSQNSSLQFCAARNIYSEAQLTQSPSLFPTFDDTVLVDLETEGQGPPFADSSSVGMDSIHYRLADSDALDFEFQSQQAESVSIEDSQGNVLMSLVSGQSVQNLPLPAGDYFLKIQSKNLERATLVVQPSGCSSGDSSLSSFRASMTTSYAHPGVYIAELPTTQVVNPASTSVTAFVGAVSQGPLNEASLITSFDDYTQTFGSLENSYPLGFAVYQFFAQGGEQAYVVGVTNENNPTPAQLIGSAEEGSGLYALDAISNDWNLLVLPDLVFMNSTDATTVVQVAMPYVNERNSFFIMDPPVNMNSPDQMIAYVETQLTGLSLEDSALYFPYVEMQNPNTGQIMTLGAGGAAAGAYANTDIQVGVWQAPAGIVYGQLLSVSALSAALNDQNQALLESYGINTIQSFVNDGIALWGARTLSLNSENIYIATKRLSQFIQKSTEQSLTWTVFEQNNPQLWATVTQVISSFLDTLWESGAMMGSTAAEAYFVVCDSSNNPPESVALGVLNISIGFAPIDPAEFEVISLTLQTEGP